MFSSDALTILSRNNLRSGNTSSFSFELRRASLGHLLSHWISWIVKCAHKYKVSSHEGSVLVADAVFFEASLLTAAAT